MAKAASPAVCMELRPGTALTLRSDRHQTLTVAKAAGRSVWMTRIGERMDYLFGAGDSVRLSPGDDITLSVNKSDGAAHIILCAQEEPSPRLSLALEWLAHPTRHVCLPARNGKGQA